MSSEVDKNKLNHNYNTNYTIVRKNPHPEVYSLKDLQLKSLLVLSG